MPVFSNDKVIWFGIGIFLEALFIIRHVLKDYYQEFFMAAGFPLLLFSPGAETHYDFYFHFLFYILAFTLLFSIYFGILTQPHVNGLLAVQFSVVLAYLVITRISSFRTSDLSTPDGTLKTGNLIFILLLLFSPFIIWAAYKQSLHLLTRDPGAKESSVNSRLWKMWPLFSILAAWGVVLWIGTYFNPDAFLDWLGGLAGIFYAVVLRGMASLFAILISLRAIHLVIRKKPIDIPGKLYFYFLFIFAALVFLASQFSFGGTLLYLIDPASKDQPSLLNLLISGMAFVYFLTHFWQLVAMYPWRRKKVYVPWHPHQPGHPRWSEASHYEYRSYFDLAAVQDGVTDENPNPRLAALVVLAQVGILAVNRFFSITPDGFAMSASLIVGVKIASVKTDTQAREKSMPLKSPPPPARQENASSAPLSMESDGVPPLAEHDGKPHAKKKRRRRK